MGKFPLVLLPLVWLSSTVCMPDLDADYGVRQKVIEGFWHLHTTGPPRSNSVALKSNYWLGPSIPLLVVHAHTCREILASKAFDSSAAV